MKSYIYKVENIKNGMVYVGKTRQDYKTRVMNHFREAFNEKTFSVFHKDIRKHGVESFESTLIETIEREKQSDFELVMNQREQYYINYYNSIDNGYNTFKNHGLAKKTGNNGLIGEREKSLERKGVCVYDSNGNLVKRYKRLVHASIDLNMHKSSISNVLARRKKHCKGYIFRWGDEVLDMSEYKDYKFVIQPRRIDYTGLFK